MISLQLTRSLVDAKHNIKYMNTYTYMTNVVMEIINFDRLNTVIDC